ncbi:MAG: glycosyltransferase, partial [Lachnospiraceae bacterium]|nr:glycosyltransferase [Lachnospiraceae bacterium]
MDKILVFIPMYNCEKQIVRVLGQFQGEICSYVSEVIVINNRSTDHGEEAVQKYLTEHPLPIPVRLLRNDENYGLGGSHKVAFQYALAHQFDYLIVLHGDDQGDISNILPYLKKGTYRKYDCFLGG